MHWTHNIICTDDLASSYDEKYGLYSCYQDDQVVLYNHPNIRVSLHHALQKVVLEPGVTVFDIGNNNGYELGFIESLFGTELLKQVRILGFDLARSALEHGRQRFKKYPLAQWIYGDAATFSGVDLNTQSKFILRDNSVNVVLALTSLQSTSLVGNLELFLEQLNKKLTSHAQLLIAVPNCHTNERGEVLPGLYNNLTRTIDVDKAAQVVDMISVTLTRQGFKIFTLGEYFKFIYCAR